MVSNENTCKDFTLNGDDKVRCTINLDDDDDDFDYEVSIESEDVPFIKIEPADDYENGTPSEISAQNIVDPCEQSPTCSKIEEVNFNTKNDHNGIILHSKIVESEENNLPECSKAYEERNSKNNNSNKKENHRNSNVITDEDIKIIWALPQVIRKRSVENDNSNGVICNGDKISSRAEDFIKLETVEENPESCSAFDLVVNSNTDGEKSSNTLSENAEIVPSFVSDNVTNDIVQELSEVNNSQAVNNASGVVEERANQLSNNFRENNKPEKSGSKIIESIRNSTIDGDFDLDDEHFAKLDQPYRENNVVLDTYNADLNIKIGAETRLIGESLSSEGFHFMLAGVRASHGFNKGKIGFEVKMLEIFDVSNVKPEETFAFEMRVGWSTSETPYRLGEWKNSYAYCNNGRKANLNMFSKIGPAFDINDVVACLIDFDNMQINFLLNGRDVCDAGYAFKFPADQQPTAYYPHVCVKNVKFEVNFGRSGIAWHGLPDGYVFVDSVPLEDRLAGPLPPATKQDCTVMCMIGLPGCGKTTWVRHYLQNHHEESWTLLSTNSVLDQMKVQGEPRKKRHLGRWDLMMGIVVKCLNKLILLACRSRRNYILDTTSVYPLPRKKKMTPFKDFAKKAVCVVPTVEDYANRCFQQMHQEGKQIPSDAMLEMKACFTLPKDDDEVFDKIVFVELQREDAQKAVDYFNEEGKSFKPREKKRRGDWQQEELPPKQPKSASSSTSNSVSRPTSAFPYGIPSSLRTYTPSPSPAFTRQWTSHGAANLTNQSANNLAALSSQSRSSISSGFTPRAGWPANWPQASWSQPTTPLPTSQQNTLSVGSQFVFPPMTTP